MARRWAIALGVGLHTAQVVTGLESAKALLGIAGVREGVGRALAGVALAPRPKSTQTVMNGEAGSFRPFAPAPKSAGRTDGRAAKSLCDARQLCQSGLQQIEVDRLGEEFAGAEFTGATAALVVTVRCHHHHGQLRAPLLDDAQ